MSPKERYLTWRRGSAIGCQFARLMAVRADDYGQHVDELKGTAPASLATAIEQHVDRCVGNADIAALTLLFPEIRDLASLVDIALALKTTPAWTVTSWIEPSAPPGPVVAFGLARNVLLPNGNPVPSEALVLGGFDVFPATRKAPVVAMEIFVGTPLPNDPKKGTPTTKTNLAHAKVAPPLNQSQFAYVWNASVKGRTASLGGIDDPRAKARVAFVVPLALAQTLGCVPSTGAS